MSEPVFATPPYVLLQLLDNDGKLGIDIITKPAVQEATLIDTLEVVLELLKERAANAGSS